MVAVLFVGLFIAGGLGFVICLKKSKREDVYNSASIPPSFIETVRNQPLVVPLASWCKIEIRQVSFLDASFYLKEIEDGFSRINAILESDKSEKRSVLLVMSYEKIISAVYLLSEKAIEKKKRKKYYRVLREKFFSNIDWGMALVESILNYWMLIKKKAYLLSRGKTLRLMYGGDASWHSFDLDIHGKMLLAPRFGKR